MRDKLKEEAGLRNLHPRIIPETEKDIQSTMYRIYVEPKEEVIENENM